MVFYRFCLIFNDFPGTWDHYEDIQTVFSDFKFKIFSDFAEPCIQRTVEMFWKKIIFETFESKNRRISDEKPKHKALYDHICDTRPRLVEPMVSKFSYFYFQSHIKSRFYFKSWESSLFHNIINWLQMVFMGEK